MEPPDAWLMGAQSPSEWTNMAGAFVHGPIAGLAIPVIGVDQCLDILVVFRNLIWRARYREPFQIHGIRQYLTGVDQDPCDFEMESNLSSDGVMADLWIRGILQHVVGVDRFSSALVINDI